MMTSLRPLFAVLTLMIVARAAEAQDRYLTWWVDGETAWSTWLVADEADGYRVVADRQGFWMSTPDGLYELRAVSRPGRELDCACEGWDGFAEPPAECIHEVPIVTPGLLAVGSTTDLRADSDARELHTWGRSSHTWTVRGTAGPLLFLEQCIDETPCGAAHPTTTCRFELWNLALGATVPLDEIFDDGTIPGPLFDRALAAFSARDGVELEPGEVTATAARVAWDAEGRLRFFVQFTMPSSYADSDGSWSSYSRSLELESELPELLRTQRHAPPTVLRFWSDRTGPDEAHGWSRITQ